MVLKPSPLGNSSGQAIVEYILLLSAIVVCFTIAARGITRSGLEEKLTRPLKGRFAHAYQLGDIKAKDIGEEGGPERHALMDSCAGCFRIFLNPGKSQ